MWNSLRDESREILWLVSIIGGLSIMGVGLAVVLVSTITHIDVVLTTSSDGVR